jgi:hypothetical protein
MVYPFSTSFSSEGHRLALVYLGSGPSCESKYQDSLCSITAEPSDSDSDEQFGIAEKAYYRQPRRLGFDRVDDSHEEILKRSRKYHETDEVCLDRPLTILGKHETLPDLPTLFGIWKNGPRAAELPGASFIYYDAKYPIQKETVQNADSNNNRRNFREHRSFEDVPDEAFIRDIWRLEK